MILGRRSATPGRDTARGQPDTLEAVPIADIHEHAAFDRFIERPCETRIGICCSGGGIRSASFNLGALQVLRHRGVLREACYLTAVSGGSYIATAHKILIDSTHRAPADCDDDGCSWGGSKAGGQGKSAFEDLAPWAPGSPEERHLRDRLSYLAPGFGGKVWLAINFIYGSVRHVLPFIAGLVLLGTAYGLAIRRWLCNSLNATSPVAVDYRASWSLAGILLILAVACLAARHLEQQREQPSAVRLDTLQGWALLFLLLAACTAVFLTAFPALFELLHRWALPDGGGLADSSFDVLTPEADGERGGGWVLFLAVAAAAVAFGASALLKRGKIARLGKAVGTLATLVFVLFPFLGFAYWTAQGQDAATRWDWTWASAFIIFVYVFFLDEVTPVTHHFYRERLATAFVGRRRASWVHPGCAQTHEQLPWSEPVKLSEAVVGDKHAKMPKLVICAAVNLSKDVPPGRGASSFTFDADYCGGPMTGYVRTRDLEKAAPVATTMPAMMAISGAAVAPSMGKMTRPSLRFLLAVFNVRLGVWLPNPMQADWRTASQTKLTDQELGESRGEPLEGNGAAIAALPKQPYKRPGFEHVFLEALGLNTLNRKFVYVTDGGHYDNLGLVELLRRGCGQILCFDAAGDDIWHFNTLSEAIALARSELGVIINIDCAPLKPPAEGPAWSPSDHVVGKITYPDGKQGVLIFTKATVTADSPQDVKSYQERDSKFPNHPTTDQFFNDERFEMYRSIGTLAAEHAVTALNSYRRRIGTRPLPGEW